MKTIRLFGDIQRHKAEWRLDVKTVSEALRAIDVQRDGFLAECDAGRYVALLIDLDDNQMSRAVTTETAYHPWAHEELWILPTVGGELPVPVIAAAFVAITGVTVANFTLIATLVNTALSMAFSAVANVITAKKQNVTASQQERPEAKPSFIADGVVNLTAAGHAHPILFGEVRDCGCMILSSDYWVEDIPV
ncbi:hypothetical protein [Methylomonas sp. CM2]|uniref:hypothetical protein n=1 Tax=Methylomonas sp. CM2 TaxID=3417647 RepID=UPI003CEF8F4C